MASTCISSCCTKDIVDNTHVYPIIPRANYTNLYKRPESDAEFMLRSINSMKGIKITDSDNGTGNTSGRFLLTGAGDYEPRVVDSLSCRQMYLRSYTFSREEEKSTTRAPVNSTLPAKTRKCLEKVIKKVKLLRKNINGKSISRGCRAAVFEHGSSNLRISLSCKRKKSIGYFVGRRKRVLVISRKLICRVKLSYSAIFRMLRRLLAACATNARRYITGRC